MSHAALIEKRNALLEALAKATATPYAEVSRALQHATEDCCGAYRHSWEITWPEHNLAHARAIAET